MSDFLEKQIAILKTRFANSPDGKIDVRPLTAENAGMLKRYATKAEMETKADVPLPVGMPRVWIQCARPRWSICRRCCSTPTNFCISTNTDKE